MEFNKKKYSDFFYQYSYDGNKKIETFISSNKSREKIFINDFDINGNLVYYKESDTEYFYEYNTGCKIIKEIKKKHYQKSDKIMEFNYIYNSKNQLEKIIYSYDISGTSLYNSIENIWTDIEDTELFRGYSILTAKYENNLLVKMKVDLNGDGNPGEIYDIAYNKQGLPIKIWSPNNTFRFYLSYKVVEKKIPIDNRYITDDFFALGRFKISLFNAFSKSEESTSY